MDIIFIIFVLAALAVGILAAESENWVFTTITIISTFAALELFFKLPIWATILANPISILLFIFMYVALGAAYTAIWRWPEALRDSARRIEDSYALYAKNCKNPSKKEFMSSAAYFSFTASANKNRLANWVLAWPLSLLWELARKPAIWVWNTAYDILGNLFERIGKRVTNNILKDK